MSVTGPMRGMGPVHYQRDKVNKCEEFHRNNCSPDGVDKCCAVVRCSYCLVWTPYGSGTGEVSTLTTDDAASWFGSVAGASIELRLARDESDRCVLEVYQDAELIESVPLCERQYDGSTVRCRDFTYSVQTTIGYDTGELSWYPFEKRKLQYRRAEDGCWTWFCGECECTCKSLCGSIQLFSQLACTTPLLDGTYSDCEDPFWTGSVTCGTDSFEFNVRLSWDADTGQCVLGGTAGQYELEWQEVDCGDIDVSWEFYDGTIVRIRCKDCGDCEDNFLYPCECRLDADASKLAYRTEATGNCLIPSPMAGATVALPTLNRAWNPEDCVFGAYLFTTRITAFPPLCTDTNPDLLSARVVIVFKLSDYDAPNTTGVLQYECYGVVYDFADNIIDISYEYAICCQNETPQNAATSHLIWIRVDGLNMPGGVYSVVLYNNTTAAMYGDCGYSPPEINDTPDPCPGGSSVWLWVPEASRWDLWEDNCPPGCTPTAPLGSGSSTSSSDPPEYGNGGCEPIPIEDPF